MTFGDERLTRKQYAEVVEAVAAFLSQKYQLYALAGHPIRDADGNPNKKAIGYLAGFTEMAMREKGLELGEVLAFGTIKAVFLKVWGSEAGDEFLTCWSGSINEPETLVGYRLGMEDCRHSTCFPLGLGRLGLCWEDANHR